MNKGSGYAVIIIIFIVLSIIWGIAKSVGSSNSYKSEQRRKAILYEAQLKEQKRNSAKHTTPTPAPARNYNSAGSGKKKNDEKDPYNAKDYYDYEDFYYDHWDDFYEVDDAEKYWKDHQ